MTKLSEIKVGDQLVADDGFTCLNPNSIRTVMANDFGELYILCNQDKHFLDGQTDQKTGELIGLALHPKP